MNETVMGAPASVEEPAPVRGPVRRGEPCPRCGGGPLDYNGMLDLVCPACGYSEGPGAGCT